MINKKRITTDLIYTVGATVILNIVFQLLVYPLINKIGGQEEFGNVTYYMSIVNIATNSIGVAVGNNRLALKNKYETNNSDYLICLSIFIPIAIITSCIILAKSFTIIDFILLAVLILCASFKSYGSVQYRIVLSYKKYFAMSLVSALGYAVGVGLFYFIRYWQIAFIIGELFGLIFILFTGNIFKPDKKGKHIDSVLKSTAILSFSSLIYEITINADRIILKNFDSARAVSVYYTVSSVPKILFMLSLPINNIILTYVANKKITLNKNVFIKLSFALIGVSGLFYLASIVGIPIFMKIFYSNMWDQGKQFMFTIPIIVIIDLLCSMITNLIFAKFGSKYHFMIFSTFLIYYAGLTIIGSKTSGIFGFITFAIISEVIKLIFVLAFGIYKFYKNEKI